MSKKIKKCETCGADIAANAKVCPNCGAKNKKPFYKRWWFILIIIILVIGAIGNINGGSSGEKLSGDFTWPENPIAAVIPQLDKTNGSLNHESDSSISFTVGKVSEKEFREYISECKASGFTVDFYGYEDSYHADDEEGYSLSLSYNKRKKILDIIIYAPNESVKETTEVTTEEATETESETEPETETEAPKTAANTSGIRPEFKEALDSYEAFFDEYCEFMKKYNNSSDTSSMISDYTKYLSRYADMMDKMDKLGDEEMNNEELKYYTDVNARITKKLLDASA